MNVITRTFKKGAGYVKHHLPKILLGTGIACGTAAIVVACKKTTKLEDTMEDTYVSLSHLHTTKELLDENDGTLTVVDEDDNVQDETYTIKNYKKDLLKVYLHAGLKLGKLYAPALILEAASIASFVGSHGIMTKRNATVTAACLATEQGFKRYRERVIEDYGEEYDRDVRLGVKRRFVEEPITKKDGTLKTDKDGNVKTEKIEVVTDPIVEIPGCYSRFFDESCRYWSKSPGANRDYVLDAMMLFNQRLAINGYVFLNDVYQHFDMAITKEGQSVGWIYDPHNKLGLGEKTQVNFGIKTDDYGDLTPAQAAFMSGHERTILLDFQPDGMILDYIPMVQYPRE